MISVYILVNEGCAQILKSRMISVYILINEGCVCLLWMMSFVRMLEDKVGLVYWQPSKWKWDKINTVKNRKYLVLNLKNAMVKAVH